MRPDGRLLAHPGSQTAKAGDGTALAGLMEARPEVFNHNTETVPRLYRRVRGPKSRYEWTLELLGRAKQIMPEIGRAHV